MTQTLKSLRKMKGKGGCDWPYIANYSKRFDYPTSYSVSMCHIYGLDTY